MKLTYYGYSPYESEYLEHHGVTGMRWGVRKTPEERARSKSRRLSRKAARLRRRADRKDRKIARTKRRATRFLMRIDTGAATRKIYRAELKRDKLRARADKLDQRAEKVLTEYSNTKLSDID